MEKCKIIIAVIEPSDIVFEGLSNLLLKSGKDIHIYRLCNPSEITTLQMKIPYNLAIVNPAIFQNRTAEFRKLKKENPGISWIGLIYSLFDEKLINSFNDYFTISDAPEMIIRKIETTLNCDTLTDNEQNVLTERETEVLIYLVKGFSQKEIADLLNISTHTVNSHRKNISDKTGIKSLSGLAIYAITKKIIPIDYTMLINKE